MKRSSRTDSHKDFKLETIMKSAPASTRRDFLQGVGIASVGVMALGMAGSVRAATMPQQPEADSGHDYKMPTPNAMTEKDFRNLLIGPATLSYLTSEMAVDRATNPRAKEFANFELREATGVLTVLKSLNTPKPPQDALSKQTLDKIKMSGNGMDFDRNYIQAQLENHEYLRDMAQSYLDNSKGQTSMPEMHGRNLATLALGTFKEHVVICKDILGELRG